MNEKQLFQQMNFIRNRTIAFLDATTEQEADIIPDGFHNSIRWNLGHILVNHEVLLSTFNEEATPLPDHLTHLFKKGTSPLEWTSAPPTLNELRAHLQQQVQRSEAYSPSLFTKKEQPLRIGNSIELFTLEELFSFSNWHEGVHQGTIVGMKHTLGLPLR
ncbi:DinB family protein [Pontibacillus salicampi]|uniref:DinB family protein n=1 Tax=Pontibacillus salicampi TaxID=1449801 RepID=A0ABV6LPN0_9BACI